MNFLAIEIDQFKIAIITLTTNRPTQRCNEASIDNSNQSVSDRDINKWVINLSKTELTTTQKAVLAKGPNYAISPSNIPNIEYITDIETIGQKLKEEEASELKVDINTILRKGQVPKSNLNKEERRALSQLRKDQDSVILTVDKGVAMVVLDKEDYISKAQELLAQLAYKEIPGDPTNKIKAHKKEFLEHLTKVDPAIKFTVEENQDNGAIPFLDTLVTPLADNSLSFKVYQKLNPY